MISQFEENILSHLLQLSTKNAPLTRPNPAAFAAVITANEVLGIGQHRGPGTPHAEVDILSTLGDKAAGHTLIVTLEPCTHWGSNPPCVNAIINSRISRVIFPILDPNPLVRANPAVQVLQKHGIDVEWGACYEQGIRANAEFLTHISYRRPFVTAKIAISLDGKMALDSGVSQTISGPDSLHRVHELRNTVDAIMVGIGTVMADDPQLTIRHVQSPRRLIKIILDSECRISPAARCFMNAEASDVIVVTTTAADPTKIQAISQIATVLPLPLDSLKNNLHIILTELYKMNIYHVLLEGGPTVLTDAIDAQLVDKLITIHSPILIGGRGRYSFYNGERTQTLVNPVRLVDIQHSIVGSDTWIDGFLNYFNTLAP